MNEFEELDLKKIKNNVLIGMLKELVIAERRLLTTVLEYLQEVNSRNLYLEMAYPSLFEFCVKELGYSAASAWRRIEAMRLIGNLPKENQNQIREKIKTGKLNLTHLTQVQGFLKSELKLKKKTYSSAEKLTVLESLESKSKLESEKELAKISPQWAPAMAESIKYLSENEVEIKFVMKSDLLNKINSLCKIKSHIKPNMKVADLLELLVSQEVKKEEKRGRWFGSNAKPLAK